MKKTLFAGSITAVFLATFLVLGSMAQAEDFKWPSMIRIGTPTTQSASFACTNGWAPILRADTGANIRVIPEDSEIRRYTRLVHSKDFELASISYADGVAAIEGHDGFMTVRAAPTRLVWFQNDTPWGWAVRGDSDIKTIYDLKRKGIRAAISTQAPSMVRNVQEGLPAFLGWTREQAEENWTWVPAGSYPDNCRTIPDGRADVAFVTPIASIAYEMEAHPRGLRWLAMPFEDREAWQRYLDKRPTAIPAKIDFGVSSAIGVEAIGSAFLYYSTPETDQEFIYHMCKWFNEAYDSYKTVHAIAPRMHVSFYRRYLNHNPMPVAEGAVRYLREIGMWTDEDDEWNDEAIEKMDRWVKARNAAIEEAEAKKVRIHYENQEFLDILEKHTKDLPIFKTRM